MLWRPGSSWGFGALLKGLTLIVVLKVERTLIIHSPHQQFLPEPRSKPTTSGYKTDALSIRPRLPSIETVSVPRSRKYKKPPKQFMSNKLIDVLQMKMNITQRNVSGYVCNHGSPSGERDTASPRGRYGERPQRDSVWRYIWKNTTCWPATAHDVTTGVPQYKCRRAKTSSASSSEACVRSMARSPGDAVSRSPLGEPWLHT